MPLYVALDEAPASIAKKRAIELAATALTSCGGPATLTASPGSGVIAHEWTSLVDARHAIASRSAVCPWHDQALRDADIDPDAARREYATLAATTGRLPIYRSPPEAAFLRNPANIEMWRTFGRIWAGFTNSAPVSSTVRLVGEDPSQIAVWCADPVPSHMERRPIGQVAPRLAGASSRPAAGGRRRLAEARADRGRARLAGALPRSTDAEP